MHPTVNPRLKIAPPSCCLVWLSLQWKHFSLYPVGYFKVTYFKSIGNQQKNFRQQNENKENIFKKKRRKLAKLQAGKLWSKFFWYTFLCMQRRERWLGIVITDLTRINHIWSAWVPSVINCLVCGQGEHWMPFTLTLERPFLMYATTFLQSS